MSRVDIETLFQALNIASRHHRRIREGCESAVSAQACEGYLALIQDIMWPGGVRRPPSLTRTDDEKYRTKHSAASKIQAIIPGKTVMRSVEQEEGSEILHPIRHRCQYDWPQ